MSHCYAIILTCRTVGGLYWQKNSNNSFTSIGGGKYYSETGVTVNGVVATVYGSEFVANHVPLEEGSNTITVTATDTAGYTATASITVTASTTGNYIQLTANIESGISPFETTFRVDGYASDTTPSISYLGPGSVDWTNCTNYEACKVKMTAEGIYTFTASGAGTDGSTYQDTVVIIVFSKSAIGALLKAKWDSMKTALMGGDMETTLTYFVEVKQDRYRQAFTELGNDNINSRFSSIVDLKLHTLYGRIGQCWAVRVESDGTFAYPVTFVKNENGFWHILGF